MVQIWHKDSKTSLAEVEGGTLRGADLRGQHLKGADLRGADLRMANLQGADLGEADLQNADLREADLRNANLREADLIHANLAGSDLGDARCRYRELEGADLSRASLEGADLTGANLTGAKLWRAGLDGADLTGARGLLVDQLAGATLRGAQLPDKVSSFEILAIIAEASKSTSTLFISMLFACTYVWVILPGTKDVALFANAGALRLPGINVDVPQRDFFLIAPIVLAGLYVYFHLSLQRLWEAVGDLPATFPDGLPLARKLPSAVLNGLVRSHTAHLSEKTEPLAWLQEWIYVLVAWGLVPLTLVFMWLRYLRRHDWYGTGLHILLIALLLGAGVFLHRLAWASLRNDVPQLHAWPQLWRQARTRGWLAGALAVSLVLVLLSLGTIEGLPERVEGSKPAKTRFSGPDAPLGWFGRVVPRILALREGRLWVDLTGADLSQKPPDSLPEDVEKAVVIPAKLAHANLRSASATWVFLAKADLRGSDLSYADLRHADLRSADLSGANLRHADLSSARLQGAQLVGADLTGAFLSNCEFSGADLRRAVLDQAELKTAFLDKVDLAGARLNGSILETTALDEANLTGVTGLTQAQLDQTWLVQIDKPPTGLPDGLTPPEAWRPATPPRQAPQARARRKRMLVAMRAG